MCKSVVQNVTALYVSHLYRMSQRFLQVSCTECHIVCVVLLYRMSQHCVQFCRTECHIGHKLLRKEILIELHLWPYVKSALTATVFLKAEWIRTVLWTSGSNYQTKTYKMRRSSVYGITYSETVIEPNFMELVFAPKLS